MSSLFILFFFTFLQLSLMSGFIENSWIPIFGSAFNWLWYVILVNVYEENWPHTDVYMGKGGLNKGLFLKG